MARKAKQRISYVLPLPNSAAGGHRLGVNGLAVDSSKSLLYSGGRDGVICAWDLHLDLQHAVTPDHDAKLPAPTATTFRQQVQAHTHWINDIALARNNEVLVSASSDVTVKVWRPSATDGQPPQTVGLHSDYVKTLAVPNATCDWVASGGLDRKINLWDLSGAGQKLSIDVGEDEAGTMQMQEKGSVYALAATDSLLASGGPEKAVRVWDCRSGRRTTKLVGHTDNVRDILISQDGTTIMTASSDRTVKVWSTIAGRCMYTLTMHDSSVWSLFSADPDLSVLYSSDKNGLVAKTDTRNTIELDEGLSVAVCQEHEGVHKVIAAGDCLWTATSRPSINRWRDVNTDNAEIDVPENYTTRRRSSAKVRSPSSLGQTDHPQGPAIVSSGDGGKRGIPLKNMLRLSNTAWFPTPILSESESSPPSARRGTLDSSNLDASVTQAVRDQPDYIVEGQNGLIKHEMLNDRKRVLTLDTAGEVVMWDLLKCVPIRSYGKRHLEDVKDEVTTASVVANWCTVDTRTGSVAVTLEENTCFDAEMYVDELELDEKIEFKDDQRINLGKWVLRYLFDNLISEEIRRDEDFRQNLLATHKRQTLQRENAPSSIEIPKSQMNGWHNGSSAAQSTTTLIPGMNGTARVSTTPGLNIGLATPGVSSPSLQPRMTHFPSTGEESTPSEQRDSMQSQRQSGERSADYFSTPRMPSGEVTSPAGTSQAATTPGDFQEPQTPTTEGLPKEGTTPSKEGLFGKKFRMGMSFSGMKKIGRIQTNEKPAIVEEKEIHETESDSRSSKTSNSRIVEDTLLGTIQKIHLAYEDSLHQQTQQQQAHENGLPVEAKAVELPTAIVPSLPSEAPVLKPPPNTTILIQEDRPEAGGVADLFEGTVGQLAEMCDLVEKVAPMWLGEVLLRNQTASKDVVKISFVLEPWHNILPSIASDGNNRLNANRMLRAKKIMAYVAERIEPKDKQDDGLRAEEYLELWCQNQVSCVLYTSGTMRLLIWLKQRVPPTMTLATIRSHIWRGGGDVLLYYKGNGRKELPQQSILEVSNTSAPPSTTSEGSEARQ